MLKNEKNPNVALIFWIGFISGVVTGLIITNVF